MSLQSNQLKFIGSPVSDILREAVVASTAIGNGIETYSVNDYILHSVFLKITGAQEQKMKCIVWELASNDYDYRYNLFSKKNLGECSCYDEKNKIYKDIIDQIAKHEPEFEHSTYLDKTNILTKVSNVIGNTLRESSLAKTYPCQYQEYLDTFSKFKAECFAPASLNNLFRKCDNCPFGKARPPRCQSLKNMSEVYDLLYHHRNRCAHNTTSYQLNLPGFSTLIQPDFRYKNYFLYFAILVLIDEVFMKLFQKYREVVELRID